MSKREKVLLAVLGSILLHGLILLVLALLVQLKPEAMASRPPQPLRLEVEEEPTPTPTPALAALPNVLPQTTPPVVDTPERARSETEPTDAIAQSDKNTLAASQDPATGAGPLPSQKGKDVPRFSLDTQPYTPGDKPAQTAKVSATAEQQQPPQPPAQPQTAPPRPQVNRNVARSTPAPTPTPEPSVAPEEIAMNAPTPTPAPTPESSPTPKPEETPPLDFSVRQPSTAPPRPRPTLPPSDPRRNAAPGYQPQTEKTLITGGLTNHGPSSIAARDTPLGRYQKAIGDAIGSRWYMYMGRLEGIPTMGSVMIHFTVDRFGKVHAARIASQAGGETFAGFSMQAIQDADIPPMPPDVYAVAKQGELEIDFSFTLE